MIDTPRRLVINADDFGLTERLSHSVVCAHSAGVVTSTSILAVSRAFETAAALARNTPTLGLGAHLAIVGEDRPLLSQREIPTLVDRDGMFPLSWRMVLRRLALRRVDPDDIRRELTAQLGRITSIGVPITHVDTHQHLHLWPSVGRVVLDLARGHDISFVRRPRSRRRVGVGSGVNLLSVQLGRQLRSRGLAATEDYAGLDEAGGLDARTLHRALGLLAAEGAATAEINAHPGEADDPGLRRFDWGYRWGEEYETLVSGSTRQLIDRLGFRLGNFGDLAAATPR